MGAALMGEIGRQRLDPIHRKDLAKFSDSN
jgi:hypothetical protein